MRALGLRHYVPVFAAMKARIDKDTEHSPDEIWALQHHPVYTQGQAGRTEHVLAPGDIPVVAADRGGQVTYHGPGQLIFYPLVQLRRRGLDVRQLVSALEQSVIAWLAELGIAAATRARAPGVYVDDAKIASLGLRIRRGRSYHGLAVNVAMDLAPFARINPCGYAGLRMTQVADLLPAAQVPGLEAAQRGLLDQLARRLGYTGWDYVGDEDRGGGGTPAPDGASDER
ncbi:MAG: lipoyl(octanoyl) transferase LipB [Porticoccaceae bacterium]